jgi:hypothetical protein
MKLLLYIKVVAALTFMSCTTTSKIHSENSCSFKQGFMSYENISDSTFSLKLQQLGKFYFNFILDSCKKIGDGELELTGYISFPDPGNVMNNQRRIPDVNIIQVTRIDNFVLKYRQYLGKTDSTGKFDIKINALGKEALILFDKKDLNQITVQLSFK